MNRTISRDFSKELEDINLGGYRHFVKSEHSFDLAASDLLQRARYHFRMWHLFDRFIPLLVLFGTAFVISILIAQSTQNKDQVVTSIAAIIAVTTTVITFLEGEHKNRHYQKLVRSSDYVKGWQSECILKHREGIKELKNSIVNKHKLKIFDSRSFNEAHTLADFKSTPGKIATLAKLQSEMLLLLFNYENSESQKSLNEILNYLESIGQDVKLGVVDADYLKDYFYYIVIDNYQIFRKYIECKQYISGSRVVWCNLVFLAHTWEKEKVPPRIPSICIRPLVLTDSDIDSVETIKPGTFQVEDASDAALTK